jgi:glycosyltransferase involved in cell wall biosynthesis
LTYGRNAAVIAVSDEVCSTVSERYRGAVQSVVHGVDLPAVRRQLDHRRAVRDELGLTDADIVIGIVANLRSQKAYPDLLAAARLVVDANPIVTFVAVGQGPDEADLHRLHGELGLGDRFRFLGMRLDALRVMAGFDIFTLSSVHEGLPVALMDALALGLPVVATDIGGIPEALTGGRDGVLVPPGRPDLLAAELLRVSGDRQVRSALAIRAAKRGLDFDMRRAIERIEGSYTDVLESGALLASHRGGGGK